MIQFTGYIAAIPDPFGVYKEAVARTERAKRDEATGVPIPPLKKRDRLGLIEPIVKGNYDAYNAAFVSQSVHTLVPHPHTPSDKKDLKSLYGSKNKVNRDLRAIFISRIPLSTYKYKCAYCCFGEGNTLEHILPKEKYPEFAIHPYNLIPCCSACNSYKGDDVIDAAGLPHTLNFYYHNPQEFRFLYAVFSLDVNSQPQISYELRFPAGTDPVKEARIRNHFDRLKLLRRYGEQINDKYVAIEREAKRALRNFSPDVIRTWLDDYYNDNVSDYGINHYYTVLIDSLRNNADFLARMSTLLTPPTTH